MTTQHPITPPFGLVRQWIEEAIPDPCYTTDIATRAAQWGADQELEACCAIALTAPVCGTKHQRRMLTHLMRERRRPKPPSLKQQALERCNDYIDPDGIIRRALEALPND
jgi:hypothetical protein